MTTPQLEDGYTRIANELLEAISGFGFTQHQFAVLLAIIRKTYGYQKKADDISASQLAEICKLPRNHVTVAVNKLVGLNVISKSKGTFGSILALNKNYRLWGKTLSLVPPAPEPDMTSGTESVPEGGTENVPAEVVQNLYSSGTESVPIASTESVHTKENLSKETQKKVRSAKPRTPRSQVCFADWISQCKEQGVQPIPEDDGVFEYAKEVDLPMDFIRYTWVEFKRKYGESSKKYKNWRQHFNNAVRENWYGVWFEKEGQWQLTTRGKQIQRELRGKA